MEYRKLCIIRQSNSRAIEKYTNISLLHNFALKSSSQKSANFPPKSKIYQVNFHKFNKFCPILVCLEAAFAEAEHSTKNTMGNNVIFFEEIRRWREWDVQEKANSAFGEPLPEERGQKA